MKISELIDRINKQDFGPKDSKIVSTLRHPIKGVGKLLEYIDNNMRDAAYADNPYDRARAGLNLAGFAQLGAMPFAPKSAPGLVGSIRKPTDVMFHRLNQGHTIPYAINEDDPPNAKRIRDLIHAYYQRTYATPDDPIVKYVDRGGSMYRDVWDYGGEASAEPYLHAGYFNGITHYDKPHLRSLMPDVPTIAPSTRMHDVLQGLREGNLDARNQRHVARIHDVAETLRKIRGTPQVAETPAGRYFEDFNDVNAMIHSYHKVPVRPNDRIHPIISAQIDALKAQPFIKDKKFDRILTNPMLDRYFGQRDSIMHIADEAGDNPRMSLVDAIMHTTRADRRRFVEGADQAAELRARHGAERAEANAAARFNLAEQRRQDELRRKNDMVRLEPALHSYELRKQFDDGNKWVKLTDRDAVEAEGTFARHCAAGYKDAVAAGDVKLYSLRDPNDQPILTMEIDPKTRRSPQIFGFYNRHMTQDEYNNYVKPFADEKNFDVRNVVENAARKWK